MGRRWNGFGEHGIGRFRDTRKPNRHPSDSRSQIARLKDELRALSGVEPEFSSGGVWPPETEKADLEDILAFESVGSGPSLFEGLEQNGLKLPPPDGLDENQCLDMAREVGRALLGLRIVLIGFERMSPRELYSTLWNETLWEACYVKKRNPYAMTLIDVSHQMSRAEIKSFLDDFMKPPVIQ